MATINMEAQETGGETPATPEASQRPENVPEKFWDAEKGEVNTKALVASYTELERKNSSQEPSDTQESTNESESGESNDSSEAFSVPGVPAESVDRFTQEITEGGTLSDESYAELEQAGYTREMVDAYVRGLTPVDEGVYEQLAQVEIDNIKKSVFGDAEDVDGSFNSMQEWAKSGLTEDELTRYNDMVTSGDTMQAQMAVQWLHGKYTGAEGKEPSLIGGNDGAPVASGFQSWQQVTTAMNDPRYQSDPAYRDEVTRKLAASELK